MSAVWAYARALAQRRGPRRGAGRAPGQQLERQLRPRDLQRRIVCRGAAPEQCVRLVQHLKCVLMLIEPAQHDAQFGEDLAAQDRLLRKAPPGPRQGAVQHLDSGDLRRGLPLQRLGVLQKIEQELAGLRSPLRQGLLAGVLAPEHDRATDQQQQGERTCGEGGRVAPAEQRDAVSQADGLGRYRPLRQHAAQIVGQALDRAVAVGGRVLQGTPQHGSKIGAERRRGIFRVTPQRSG
jgi:hypothetical protein